MRWFRKPFKCIADETGQYLVSSHVTPVYGAGDTEEEAIVDFLSELSYHYQWLLENKHKLAPSLAKELKSITKFFGGEE